MKYTQTKEEASEVFRNVLQYISKYNLSINPLCYAVCYEHIANINPALTIAIKTLLDKSNTLSEDDMIYLYNHYVSEVTPEVALELQNNVSKVISDVTSVTTDLDKNVGGYGDDIKSAKDTLSAGNTKAIEKTLIDLVDKTTSMYYVVNNLQENLASSQNELTNLKNELERTRIEALIDPLTELANRRKFDKDFETAIKQSLEMSQSVSFIMVDIDHFKKINDTYGHLFGDRVIQVVANLLVSSFGKEKCIARLGGEEFGIILPNINILVAFEMSEKIRKTIELSKIRQGKKEVGGITVSVGVGELAKNEGLRAFYGRVDKALYNSKNGGRNKVSKA